MYTPTHLPCLVARRRPARAATRAQRTHSCPTPAHKVAVLREMVFPNCEKLGQTIIFVRTKDTSRSLHRQLQDLGYKITSIQVRRARIHACVRACMLEGVCACLVCVWCVCVCVFGRVCVCVCVCLGVWSRDPTCRLCYRRDTIGAPHSCRHTHSAHA
jgi:hypothetical protein